MVLQLFMLVAVEVMEMLAVVLEEMAAAVLEVHLLELLERQIEVVEVAVHLLAVVE
jgi:hypothetical protein